MSQTANYFETIMVVIFAWVLVDLWARTVNSLAYNYFGLDSKSAWNVFIVAMVVTVLLFAFIISHTNIHIRINDFMSVPSESDIEEIIPS